MIAFRTFSGIREALMEIEKLAPLFPRCPVDEITSMGDLMRKLAQEVFCGHFTGQLIICQDALRYTDGVCQISYLDIGDGKVQVTITIHQGVLPSVFDLGVMAPDYLARLKKIEETCSRARTSGWEVSS